MYGETATQSDLERLTEIFSGRAIWTEEVTWVPPSSNGLLLLISSVEAAAVGGRSDYSGREVVQSLKHAIAQNLKYGIVQDDYFRHDYDYLRSLYPNNYPRPVKDKTPPVFEILRRVAPVQDPIFVLPFVDYEINFHDHNRLLAEIGRYFRPEMQAVVVGQCFPGFGNFGNDSFSYVHRLTDGQYNALRGNAIRSPKKSEQPHASNSCFVSYSGEDKEFAIRLSRDLEARGLRVWLAADDLRGGRKLDEQIEEAIHKHDNFIVILSKHSMSNQWVRAEINWAKEKGRKFFPVSLVPLNKIKWDDMMDYFVFDFSKAYQFEGLVRDLKGQSRVADSDLERVKWFATVGNAYVHPHKSPDFEQGDKGSNGLWLDLECNYCLGQVWFDFLTRRYRCSRCSALDNQPYMSLK